jgi:hypothetical protein
MVSEWCANLDVAVYDCGDNSLLCLYFPAKSLVYNITDLIMVLFPAIPVASNMRLYPCKPSFGPERGK